VFQAQLDERLETEVRSIATEEIEASLQTQDGFRDRMAPLTSIRSLWEKDQRLRDSVFATAENVVAPYAYVNATPTVESIDASEWLSGDNTIYVIAPSHEQARLRPVLTTFVQQNVRCAFSTALQERGSLTNPCLVLLDEAGNVAPLRDLPEYASTARAHGISLVTIWQDLAQIKAIYRDRAQTVLNNHRAKLFGTGIADDQTLEYVSRLIGDSANKEHNTSRDLQGGRRSVSEHTTYRRAAPIDVLRRIRMNEAVLLYGSELPVRLRLRPWFKDRTLAKLANERDEAA
jgi:type IV secretion system protein VirD4